jgi:hypothetical protein
VGTVTIGVSIAVPEPHGSLLQERRAGFGDPAAHGIPTHVTLLPPTEVDASALPAIEAHLVEVAAAGRPFPMRLSGTGTFRPLSPVVFVQVVEGAEACTWLQKQVRDASGPSRASCSSRTTRTSPWRTASTTRRWTGRSRSSPTTRGVAVHRLRALRAGRRRRVATHAWRSYERLERVHWTRLAAAITFISFLAFFPLITVAAAIGAATLTESQMRHLQSKLAQQIPGISGQLDLSGLIQNAATIGIVAGAVLLFTGIGWVGSMRECLRAVWELDDERTRPSCARLKDGRVLIGLGGAPRLVRRLHVAVRHQLGARSSSASPSTAGAGWLLRIAAFAVAVSPTSCCSCTS